MDFKYKRTPPAFTDAPPEYKSYKNKGALTLLFRARCACGIWKDVEPPSQEFAWTRVARAQLMAAGWTKVDEDPTCARCSEVAALEVTNAHRR